MSDSSSSPNPSHTGQFARSRWSHVLALADQLRQNTVIHKNEHLRQYAFDIPSTNDGQKSSLAHADHVKSFENALLSAKTGNFNLDNLSEKFIDLKRTFNHMLELNKNDIQTFSPSTQITTNPK